MPGSETVPLSEVLPFVFVNCCPVLASPAYYNFLSVPTALQISNPALFFSNFRSWHQIYSATQTPSSPFRSISLHAVEAEHQAGAGATKKGGHSLGGLISLTADQLEHHYPDTRGVAGFYTEGAECLTEILLLKTDSHPPPHDWDMRQKHTFCTYKHLDFSTLSLTILTAVTFVVYIFVSSWNFNKKPLFQGHPLRYHSPLAPAPEVTRPNSSLTLRYKESDKETQMSAVAVVNWEYICNWLHLPSKYLQ